MKKQDKVKGFFFFFWSGSAPSSSLFSFGFLTERPRWHVSLESTPATRFDAKFARRRSIDGWLGMFPSRRVRKWTGGQTNDLWLFRGSNKAIQFKADER